MKNVDRYRKLIINFLFDNKDDFKIRELIYRQYNIDIRSLNKKDLYLVLLKWSKDESI